jgi:hypothetical protein
MARIFPNELFDVLPSMEEAERMSFEDRIHQGFELALSEGLDLSFALSSVTVAIGERFRQRNGSSVDVRTLIKKPKSMLRLAKALVKSKLARRPMLPKDLWALKGMVTFGMDGSVYREKIKRMWGRYPLDFHGCTEAVGKMPLTSRQPFCWTRLSRAGTSWLSPTSMAAPSPGTARDI